MCIWSYWDSVCLHHCFSALLKVRERRILGEEGGGEEQIYLGINRFGSAIQHLSAAFSASLLPSVRRAQKSDWKVSLWACSILGKNLKKKKPKPKPIPWNKKIMLVKWSVLYPCPVSKQSLTGRGAALCPPWLPDPRIRLKRSGLSSFFPFPLPIPALIFFSSWNRVSDSLSPFQWGKKNLFAFSITTFTDNHEDFANHLSGCTWNSSCCNDPGERKGGSWWMKRKG